jgi:hypothetical protein
MKWLGFSASRYAGEAAGGGCERFVSSHANLLLMR